MYFINLDTQPTLLNDEIYAGIQHVLAYSHYILGPEEFMLEEELAIFERTQHSLYIYLNLIMQLWFKSLKDYYNEFF